MKELKELKESRWEATFWTEGILKQYHFNITLSSTIQAEDIRTVTTTDSYGYSIYRA